MRRTLPSVLGAIALGAALITPGAALAASESLDSIDTVDGLPAPRFTSASTTDLPGMFPGDIAVADFTGDGKRDAAVALSSIQTTPGLVVEVGDGKGGFTRQIDTALPGGAQACGVAAGDLDGDQFADVAVTTCGFGLQLVLLTGNGDGTFEAGQPITVGTGIGHVAIGRLNADTKADVVVTRESGGVYVYFGNGDGTVGQPTTYPGAGGGSQVRIIDITGDGKLDVALNGPSTMVNTGGGALAAPVGADFFASRSALVDLDGDGILDAAGVDGTGRHVFLARGTSDGRYHLEETLELNVSQTTWVAGGDFTGEGDGDVVVNGDGQIVYLYAGNGDLTVKAPVAYSTGAELLTAVDLGGSSATDLVSRTSDPGTLFAALGAKGGFAAAKLVPSAVPGEIATGDLNGDGLADVATAGGVLTDDGQESDLGVDLNKGNGKFVPTKRYLLRTETAGSGVAALTLADMDLDGDLDAVGGFENFQFSPYNLFVTLNNGKGKFGPAHLTATPDQTGSVLDVAVGDVTGDGKPDLVTNTSTKIIVLPGKGDGTFQAPIVTGTAGVQTTRILLGEVTGDSVTDVVAILLTGGRDFSSGAFVVQAGDGAGHFTEVQRVIVDTNLLGAALADFNGDGRLDAAANGRGGTNGGRPGMHVLLQKPTGLFSEPVYYPSGAGHLVVADLNLDGKLDIAAEGPKDITAINLGRGNGTFSLNHLVVTPNPPSAIADVTGDGAPDVLTEPSARDAAFGLTVNLRKS